MANYETYAGWRAALKKLYPGEKIDYEGDKDIAQAFVTVNGKRIGAGEWDGAHGEVYSKKDDDCAMSATDGYKLDAAMMMMDAASK